MKTLVIYSPFVVTKEIDAEIRTFFKSAIKYRELLNIVQARFGTENGNALYQYMGRPFSNRTEVWIFEKTEDGIEKYPMIDLEAQQASSTEEPLPQGAPISEASLAAFIESYLAGSLLPELKTQPAPTAEELGSSPDYLSFLVGKTLPPVVSSSKTPMLVLFFSTSCEYSKEFAPIFDEIASQLHPTGKVRFGVIEGTKNQVRGLPVEGFPVVFLFRGQNTDKQSDDKDNETEGKTSGWELENTRFVEGLGEVVEFWGQRTRLSLLAFILNELSHVSLVEVLGEKESNEVEAQFKIEYEGGEDSMEVQFDEEEINRLLEEQLAEQNAEKGNETPESIAKDLDTDL